MQVSAWSLRQRQAAWVAGAVLGLAALIGLYVAYAGTAGGARLRQQEFVVQFAPGATSAEHTAVRAACTGLPHATPEPPTASTKVSDRLSDVRFRIDDADAADLSALVRCVRGRPGVVGFDIPDGM